MPEQPVTLSPLRSVPGMGRVRRIHFVGVGGVGMGGIAEVLHTLGYEVSGSDLRESAMTARLAELGVRIGIGHDAAHAQDADVLVTSTAIDEANPEVHWARENDIPLVQRAEMLAELMRFRHGIAVAGTHGKTTTTSLIASVLGEGGLDPTFVIGGRLIGAGTNARLGEGEYLVAEADESDASFLHLKPLLAVITNVDMDHMDTYDGDPDRLDQTFIEFVQHLPFYGLVVLCSDDEGVRRVRARIGRPVLSYGFEDGADVQAVDVRQTGPRMTFTVQHAGHDTFEFELNLAGRHNVLNALAAIAVARELGVDDAAILRGLGGFEGIGRRFQIFGEVPVAGRRVLLVDDYGHHPREIEATVLAARAAWPDRRLVVAFQLHRYSRTRDLFEDFASVLSDLETLILLDVYAAGEAPIAGADGRALARAIRNRGRVDPVFVNGPDDLPKALEGVLHNDDVLLLLGAGSIGTVARDLAIAGDVQ
jgi:UDP-N-acetylmuramate--alanine ligase